MMRCPGLGYQKTVVHWQTEEEEGQRSKPKFNPFSRYYTLDDVVECYSENSFDSAALPCEPPHHHTCSRSSSPAYRVDKGHVPQEGEGEEGRDGGCS